MAKNVYVVFLTNPGKVELAKVIPFWINEVPLVGSYLSCSKFDAAPPFLRLNIEGTNAMGNPVQFDLHIKDAYVRAIARTSELGKIGIIGIT